MPKLSSILAQQELSRRASPIPFDVRSYLFTQQQNFKFDSSRFKVAVCSRRSGKTVACAGDLIDVAVKNANVVCLYITLSRKNAKRIIWPELNKLNREHKLSGRVDNTELSITFPNGSVIYCSGAKDTSEIEKFRGLALKLVYIDECQSFRAYISTLIDDILAPALLDHAGTLCLIGTPGPIPAGYFYDCFSSTNVWSKHTWTFFDNPFIALKSGTTHIALLNTELERKGVSVEDPSVQREYFGRWVMDSDSLLLKYDKGINDFSELAPGKWEYIMGVDIGFVDADAIAILAYNDSSPTVYLVEESIKTKQDLTDLANEIQRLTKKYNVNKIVMDEGALGKKLAEEMRRRFHIPIQPAEKQRKMENVAFLNDAMRTGRFKARIDSIFAQDSYLVEIDRDKSTPDKIKVKDNFHSDIIDAVLYAFKVSPAYAWQAAPIKPIHKSKEYYKQLTDDMEQAALDFFTTQEQALKDPYDEFG